MSTPRGTLRNRLEFWAAMALLGVLRVLPGRLCLALLRGVGSLAHRVNGARRKHAIECVVRALGRSPVEADAIVRACTQSMAMSLYEPTLFARAVERDGLEAHVTIEGAEHLDAALAAGRGVLLATAHFGAWECFGTVLCERFKPVWAVARPIDNPLLDAWVRTSRARTSAGTVDKDGGGLKMARLLRDGEIVFALLDQNAGTAGVVMDFLGVPSSHHRVAGAMACRFGAAVIPAYLRREPGYLRFRLILEPSVEPRPELSGEAAQLDVIRRVSDSLERQVRELPEQWLWLHDRWKRALRELRRAARKKREAAAAGAGAEATADSRAIEAALAEGTNEL